MSKEEKKITGLSKTYSQKTDKELRQLALDIAEGKVFLTSDPREIRLSFSLLVACMGEDTRKEMERLDVVAFYEEMKQAGLERVNGLPIFYSARIVTRGEMKRLSEAYDEVIAFRKKFVNDADEGDA